MRSSSKSEELCVSESQHYVDEELRVSGSQLLQTKSFFFFWLNALNTQATEHRGANPPPNEGFVQHAARDT